MWGLACLRLLPDAKFVETMSQRAVVDASILTPAAVTQLMWAFATMRVSPGRELREALLTRATDVVGDLGAREAAEMMWGVVTLKLEGADGLVWGLVARVQAMAEELSEGEIMSCLGTLEKWRQIEIAKGRERDGELRGELDAACETLYRQRKAKAANKQDTRRMREGASGGTRARGRA